MQTDEQMARALFGDTSARPATADSSPRPATAASTDEQMIAALYPADVEVRRALDRKTRRCSPRSAQLDSTRPGQEHVRRPGPGRHTSFRVKGLAESSIDGEAAQAADPTAYQAAVKKQTATARRELRATLAAEHAGATPRSCSGGPRGPIGTVPGLATILASHGLGRTENFKGILDHARRRPRPLRSDDESHAHPDGRAARR